MLAAAGAAIAPPAASHRARRHQASNVLATAEGKAQLIDFGIPMLCDSTAPTAEYAAPEVLSGNHEREKAEQARRL